MNGLKQKPEAAFRAAGLAALTAVMLLISGCGPAPTGKQQPDVKKQVVAAPNLPLSCGWKCAIAITNAAIDLSDRCLAQKKVALAYLAEGDVETARNCAAQIEDWNRGMVLAAVAEWLIAHGEKAKAEAMLPELQACAFMAKDWQRAWLRSAMVRVYALLGREEEVRGSISNLTAYANLAGDAAASLALVLARTGRVDEANTVLGNLAKVNNPDIAAARAKGYVDLVLSGHLDSNSAPGVLTNAWEATERIKPYRRWEVQMMVIEAMSKNGLEASAREHLLALVPTIEAAVKMPPEVRAAVLSQASMIWKRLGELQRSREMCISAEKTIGILEIVIQPEAYTRLAEGYLSAGEKIQARTFYVRALDIATGLENRRPRAVAGVEVCVSLAAHKEVIDADIQKRLERLVGTFDATRP